MIVGLVVAAGLLLYGILIRWGPETMILRLTLTTAHLVGECAGEWHGSGSGLVAPDHTPVLYPGFPIPGGHPTL